MAEPVPLQDLEEYVEDIRELKIKAFFHASVDEYIKGKKGEPSGQKKETKRKEQDTVKDAQQKKSKLENTHAHSSTPKPFTSRFNNYTPLNTLRE